jgi:hypothetical protein
VLIPLSLRRWLAPLSEMTSAWWTMRSIIAAATTWSPKTSPQRANGRLLVRIGEAYSYREETSWNNRFAASCSNGMKSTSSTYADIGLLEVGTDAAEGHYRLVDAAYEKRSIAVGRTCTPPASTSSCPRPSRPRSLTGSCTTRTSAGPRATRSASPRPSPGKGSPR